jgi:hypothetical protein
VCYLHAWAAADRRRCPHRRPWRCLVGPARRTLHAGAPRISGSNPSSTRTEHSECSNTVFCVATVGYLLKLGALSAHGGSSQYSHWGTLSAHTGVLRPLTMGCSEYSLWGTRSTHRWAPVWPCLHRSEGMRMRTCVCTSSDYRLGAMHPKSRPRSRRRCTERRAPSCPPPASNL